MLSFCGKEAEILPLDFLSSHAMIKMMRISDMPQPGLEPVLNLSSGFVE